MILVSNYFLFNARFNAKAYLYNQNAAMQPHNLWSTLHDIK